MEFAKVKPKLTKALAAEKKSLKELALAVHRHPETAFKEHKTSELLIQYLAGRGFRIERKLAGLPTGFRAYSVHKAAKPAVAFLAEMDALPGLGHACGHNLIAASSAQAAVILRKAFPELKGSIEVIGCPAEERGGGKIILNNAGVFDHLDFAMLIHPSDRTEIYKLSLALVEVQLEFIGKSAHAAAAPEKGINALDAAIQTFNSVNTLRSRLKGFARINGIITEGGKAPNIIPDRAKAEFWVRDERLDKTFQNVELVVQAARSAAKAIGAKLKAEVNRELAYAPFLPSRAAGEVLRQAFDALKIKIEQGDEKAEMGSTDLGNLSRKIPALHPALAISAAAVHTPGFAAAAASGKGMEMMQKAGLAMSVLGHRVMTDAKLRGKMKAELKRSTGQG